MTKGMNQSGNTLYSILTVICTTGVLRVKNEYTYFLEQHQMGNYAQLF